MIKAELKDIARGRWHFILTSLGVPEQCLRNKHGPCPSCGGRDRFRYDDKNGDGTFYCNNCDAGDGFKLLQLVHGWSFPEALQYVSDLLGGAAQNLPPRTLITAPKSNEPDWELYRKMLALWEKGVPISMSDPAGLYLTQTRGIELTEFPGSLRFHPNAWTEGTSFPAMLARFDSPAGELVALHRTFLTKDGAKAVIAKPKRFYSGYKRGATKGGAVRLGEPEDILGIAEGIETGLAVSLAVGIPVWASCNAGLLKQVVIPDRVRKVWIFADNDTNNTGNMAAENLALRLAREGRDVKLALPIEPGVDFLDIYLGGNLVHEKVGF